MVGWEMVDGRRAYGSIMDEGAWNAGKVLRSGLLK
jgi:hypothetical protein